MRLLKLKIDFGTTYMDAKLDSKGLDGCLTKIMPLPTVEALRKMCDDSIKERKKQAKGKGKSLGFEVKKKSAR